jgi:CheY-like chemotaxis protein
MTNPDAPKPVMAPAPAPPDDPSDLDFSWLAQPLPEPAPPPPLPVEQQQSAEEIALIGDRNLGTEGFHVVLAKRRAGSGVGNDVVLVVDDDQPMAELAAHHLRKAGYQPVVAHTPHDAARHMKKLGPPALVILDVQMPEMNGIDFLARMRANKYLRETPVILFTAYSDRADIVRGLQAGADGYLAKPVTAAALVSAVRTVLGQ